MRRSRAEKDLDGAPLIHGLVAVGGLVERELEVEDLAGVDRAVPDQVDQLGQEPAHRGGAAVQVDVGEEHLLTGQLHTMGDADEADVPALRGWSGWPASSTPGCPRPRSPSARPARW